MSGTRASLERSVIDVAGLPTTVFGPRDILWWGTLGFLVIEGTTLFICVAAYFFLWRNEPTWPPGHTLRPSLGWPTVHVLFLVVSNAAARQLSKSAHALDEHRTRRWLLVLAVIAAISLALRWQDFLALNVRWDTNAYGSIVWLTVGLHATLIAAELGELALMYALLVSERREERHLADASDVAFYWYGLTLFWVPLYLMIYLGPRWLR
jgi:heme/copper-type cytochrome/quinol oxidase subunit 3